MATNAVRRARMSIAARTTSATRKPPSLMAERVARALAPLERRLPRHAGVAATAVILLATAAFGIVKGNHTGEIVAAFSDARNAVANAAGFKIASLSITGRKQLTQEEVLAIGGVTGRSSLLFLNAASVRDRLKASPWIADATVLKLYPGHLQVDITERTAFALWQRDGHVSVISDDGAVLESYVARRFTTLPLIVGRGAATQAKSFLAQLDRYPRVRASTKAIIYVGERRWNLRLADGLDVRLPEAGLDKALAMLAQLDKDDALFSRDITAIDLRLPDRVTVRLSEDAAKARDDAAKKVKRKGDSA